MPPLASPTTMLASPAGGSPGPMAAASPSGGAGGAIDLGYVPSYAMEDYNRTKGAKGVMPPEPQYPSLNIEGDPAAALMGGGVEVGQTVTATITCRVVGMRKRATKSGSSMSPSNGDNNIELEVSDITITNVGGDGSDESQPMGAGAAMDSYRASLGAGGGGAAAGGGMDDMGDQ